MTAAAPEYWFYHLEASTLEAVLPDLLEKTLAKGWRALVKLPQEKLAEMDQFLWTFRDEAFLPHGRDDEPKADQQPILLSAALDSVKDFDAAFLIDGAELSDVSGLSRVMVMINGRSEADIARERGRWKTLKEAGANLTYFQQNARGGWDKKA